MGYCPRVAGVRMPATYINHYAANGGVVVPQFGGWAEETDRRAIETLQAAYGPDYKVHSLPPQLQVTAVSMQTAMKQLPSPVTFTSTYILPAQQRSLLLHYMWHQLLLLRISIIDVIYAMQVVGVKSREVLLNAGNIHCITQQWVAGW